LAGFSDLAEVHAELEALARCDEPLVVRLARVPGQKEDRYAHLCGAAHDAPAGVPAAPSRPDAGADSGRAAAEMPSAPVAERPGALSDEVAALRAEVATLRRDLDDLRSQLGA
jgi:hypothetical protein